MKALFRFLLLNTFIILFVHGYSQTKREFRAVWVSTVANIDWPSKAGLSTEQQQEEIINILDVHKKNNLNVIILQVRPCSDAIYKSDKEPWSKYLNGKQGLAPEPMYDPLAFWITEAHKRGMELHAWFNPYRIKQNLEDTLSEDHIVNKHPDWFWEYGTRWYYEPGHPEVWKFVNEVVTDVVRRYDIDAVHFDDYFYPYSYQGKPFPDSAAFAMYGKQFFPSQIDQWRKHNVDTIIQILSKSIKETKPWVKFGISPFGVWRNRSQDSIGSETTAGTTNFDNLYADVIKWQKEGWIDYLMPQLYWSDGFTIAPFSTLAYWWNEHDYGRGMYFGLAPYRIDKKSEDKLWRNQKYFLNQIDLIRQLDHTQGYGFFSSSVFLRKDRKSLNKSLKKNYCNTPALTPKMIWIDNIAPSCPTNLTITDTQILQWNEPSNSSALNRVKFYVVYEYKSDERVSDSGAGNILSVTSDKSITLTKKQKGSVIRVSAVDYAGNESPLSESITIDKN